MEWVDNGSTTAVSSVSIEREVSITKERDMPGQTREWIGTECTEKQD